MTIILDMGGVLMCHNMPAAIAQFTDLLGADAVTHFLGLASNGEGQSDTLMEQFELGLISADAFLDALLAYAQSHPQPHQKPLPRATRDALRAAWNAMHGGIPSDCIDLLRTWKSQGHHLFLLSNNNALHWQDILDHYPDLMSLFDHCFASHLLHCAKPSPAIYHLVNDYLLQASLPAPYYFVDDLPANRLPASALSWLTFPDLPSLQQHLQSHFPSHPQSPS